MAIEKGEGSRIFQNLPTKNCQLEGVKHQNKFRHLFRLVPYQIHTSILIALTFNCHNYKIKIDYFLRIESDYLLRKKKYSRKIPWKHGWPWRAIAVNSLCSPGVSKLTRSMQRSRQKLRPLNQSQSSNLCQGSLHDKK